MKALLQLVKGDQNTVVHNSNVPGMTYSIIIGGKPIWFKIITFDIQKAMLAIEQTYVMKPMRVCDCSVKVKL